jgi:hypothetical protein
MVFSRRKLITYAASFVLAVVALASLYVWTTLAFTYSDGERAGYVQKFSRRGWVCKTWEGDLALVNLPGQPAELFPFTVRDDVVAAKINALVGRRVAVRYTQHVGIPSKCFGDTEYFVVDVNAVE